MNANGFYSSIRNFDSPCYNSGKDCPKRHVGCRENCDEWDKYTAMREAEKAKVREYYRGQKLCESYTYRTVEVYKEKKRRKAGKKDYFNG